MTSIEILVATMFQKDLSKYNEMNIQTDAVFANQDDRYDYLEKVINGNTVKMITTAQRGLGNNRNIALSHAKADILVLADDDLVYMDDYKETLLNAFNELNFYGLTPIGFTASGFACPPSAGRLHLQAYACSISGGIKDTDTRSSPCFKDFDEEFFFNKGAWLSVVFPLLKYFGAIFFALKIKKKTNLNQDEIYNQTPICRNKVMSFPIKNGKIK
jgi:glycosyltransferase involved in cell wall biosynthesis